MQLLADGEPGFSWAHSIFFAAYNTMKKRGANVDSPYLNPSWLKEIEQFEQVENVSIFVPVGPWTSGFTLMARDSKTELRSSQKCRRKL